MPLSFLHAAPPSPTVVDAPFVRLWRGFLTGRAMVALALLFLLGMGQFVNLMAEPAVLAVCGAYLMATVVTRAVAANRPPEPTAGLHWLAFIGVDVAAVCALLFLQAGAMNYTPLFGLPILMAAMLGSLTVALGTTAGVTLLLLAWAWWQGLHSGGDNAQRYLQSALAGTGYFVITYLVHQLSVRLAREQQVARQSQIAARVQSQVSTLVIEHLTDGVLVIDPRNVVHIANPAALVLLGEPAGLAPPFSLKFSPAWEPLVELAQSTFRQEQPISTDADLLQPGQSPTGVHVRTWLTPARTGPHKESDERLCVMFLHDLRVLEARLRTEKLAAMGRMSAAVAHEIRNPLAAIVQANALLAEELSDPGQQRLTHMVQQNAERLARITEEVLDIARVRHQSHNTPVPVLRLDETVAQIWADWQRQDPAQRRATLSLQAHDAQIEFDIEHLRRVLFNLLDNALRYKGQDDDSLDISTRVSPSGHISLQVWSDGAPMDKSVERRLFEPFFSSESRSSGLGLYICRELCQRYGASIAYQRRQHARPRGPISGNAFIVDFRRNTRPAENATLFDTIAA